MRALDFTVKEVSHKLMAKLAPAYLRDAKKPYNIEADPRVIEDGFTAACELIDYLAADRRRRPGSPGQPL